MKTTLLCALGLLAAGVSTASAQQGGGRLAEFLKRADKDGDGKISKEEFKSLSQRDDGDERFSRMDTNGDGFVDQSEMAAIGERMRRGPGGPPESPGSKSEGGFRRPPSENPEGKPAPEGERPPGPPGERPPGDRPQGDRPPGGPGMGPNPEEIYGRMDKNSDGFVDKDEYVAFAREEIEQRFGRLDENADGKISKEEMKAGMERLRNAMRGGQGGPPGMPGGEGMRRPGGGPPGEGGFRRPEGGPP
ncbi:MAG TPA: EF-hand domain-containing protein, partial [Prosthecobacter sp.]|nr:EF-hand domain-containing protein [Prosthecobacter sp.]